MASPFNGVTPPGGPPDPPPVATRLRPNGERHWKLASDGLRHRISVDLPIRWELRQIGVEDVTGVDVLPSLERRHQPSANIYRPITEREHPAVAGHRTSLTIADVELALDVSIA